MNNMGKASSMFGAFGFGGSMFDDDDFFKGTGISSGFSSFSSGGGFGGGLSKSVSTTTKTM